jgi:ATP-dependent Clp protease ATP-binding subunit ClpC
VKRDQELEEKLAYQEMRKKLLDSLKRVFRPEFINRVDAVIVFRALSMESIKEIVQLELDKVSLRLEEHDIVISITQAALELIAEMGYDPEMGARPLRRVIQQNIEDSLSDSLLGGEFEDGDTIVVDVVDEEISLHKKEENPIVEEEILAAG